MKILYIGQYTDGSTSKMRADRIKAILKPDVFEVIDIHQPFFHTHRFWRSIGFRYKTGPLIRNINTYIKKNIDDFSVNKFDTIWVDKAVFISPDTTFLLKNHTNKLIHFTPDPAFTYHRSKLFFDSLKYYDFLITTKRYEIEDYNNAIKNSKSTVLYATQGFDKTFHTPVVPFHKKKGVVFIGHYEKERAMVLQKLLDANIPVILAGIKWEDFAKRNKQMLLNYLGCGVFGSKYVETISSGLFALGSISKWVPEKHTTRTFEIPACGTALLTEKNDELQSFYEDNEVVFYQDTDDLIQKIHYYSAHLDELEALTIRGTQKVHKGGFDYESIIRELLLKIKIQ